MWCLVAGNALLFFILILHSTSTCQAFSFHYPLPFLLLSCYSKLMILLYTIILFFMLIVLHFGILRCTLGVGSCLVLASDPSSYIFILTLSSISISVLTWSYYYIDTDLDFRRFTSILLLFLCSIFGLVFSADLLSLLVSWDLLGFSSFFLVIFYRTRASLAGGLLTGLTNRIGDVFLLALFGLLFYRSVSLMSWALYLLLVISFTKSAQVPFSSWLPAAILAPTPVSALVHSSTLVTAGVYLLFRFCPLNSTLLLNVGIFTTLIAGLAASLECDTKKIIALSTLRQLGLIVTSLGLGARSLCFAHLNTHAAFKALLFLGIGSYIHSIYGSQEARSVVQVHSNSPFSIVVLLSASLSMCGLVFLSGWVTKEAILESRFNNVVSLISLLFFYLGIGLTLVYSLRLAYTLIYTSTHITPLSPTFSSPLNAKAPMYWLLSLSVLQGYFFNLNCFACPSFQSFEDKLVVWGVLLVSFVLGLCLVLGPIAAPSPFLYLGYSTSLLCNLTVVVSPVHSTEVAAFQGCGLGCLHTLVTPIRLGSHFFTKLTVILSFCFVIL